MNRNAILQRFKRKQNRWGLYPRSIFPFDTHTAETLTEMIEDGLIDGGWLYRYDDIYERCYTLTDKGKLVLEELR